MGSCNSKRNEVLILFGSNSKDSLHKAFLNYIIQLDCFSDHLLTINIPDLSQLPFYNQDFILQHKIPQKVFEAFRSVSKAKKIIFLTPQYNGTTTPDLINTIQWITEISKIKNNHIQPFHHKLIGIISCSYISQNQIDDLKIMMSDSHPRFFREDFYVDLKSGEFDVQRKQLSSKLRNNLLEWLEKFLRYQ